MPKKKKNKQYKKELRDRDALKNKITGLFSNNPARTWNHKQVAGLLNMTGKEDKKEIEKVLRELKKEARLEEIRPGKYKFRSRSGFITGTVDMTAYGNAYVVSDELDEDVYVSETNLHHALNGDKVKVYLFARRRDRRLEGEVVEILERKRKTFVGVVTITGHYAFLVPDNRLMPYDIFIPRSRLNGAKNGQKAIARITKWPEKVKNPFGEIVEVLGNPGEHETEIHAILAEFELPAKFTPGVERAAEQIPDRITKKDLEGRRDFRRVTTFTIDPADAKDFDDALSIRFLKDGNVEVGVHIADVTHYVRPGMLLDREAYDRATSVYLVDRVVPMLPEHLSNGVCSLNPHEDKLTFSAVFKMTPDARVVDSWFGKTVINSDRRYAYEEAQEIIEKKKGDLSKEILTLHRMAQILRKRRFQQGSLDIERVEVKFDIDEKGTPLGVFFKVSREANQLIEEFMLLANRHVAELVGKRMSGGGKKKVFVYRVHDKPKEDRLESFTRIAAKLGYEVHAESRKALSQSMNRLIKQVVGKPEQNLIETLALRAMAKAVYTTKNIGHYGLAFDYYTHFTSPIRRYPDMMVHRLLEHYLRGGKTVDEEEYEGKCRHASEMERKAIDAERASIKYKQVEYLADKVGEVYDGIIAGVTDWGIYVEINENKCEGMIPIRELNDDFYEFDEENYTITGRRKGRRFQLGDPIRVEIYRVNLEKRQLDLLLAE
jgi:ribonuclease R